VDCLSSNAPSMETRHHGTSVRCGICNTFSGLQGNAAWETQAGRQCLLLVSSTVCGFVFVVVLCSIAFLRVCSADVSVC